MATQTAEKVTPISKRKDTEILLNGKLIESTQVGTDKNNYPIYENIIILPAEDEYSHPTRYCVKSRNRIGEKDSVVSIVASVNCRPWRDQNGRYRYPHELWAV